MKKTRNVKDYIFDNLDEIEKMAREGNTETEIKKALGVSAATWNKYKKSNKEIQDALDKGYKRSIKKVEAALFKSACGYSYDEITQERDAKGNMIVTKIVKKEVQPNVSAIMNILKNKLQGEYDAPEKIDVKGKIEQKSVIEAVPTEDVAKLAEMMLKKRADENDI